MLQTIQNNIRLRVDRSCPGAFLWRLRSTPDGSQQEDLISEGAAYQVMDAAFYFSRLRQKPAAFSRADLQAIKQAYLLLDRGPKTMREVQFVFETPDLIITSSDVDCASVNFLLNSGDNQHMIGLSFFLWVENGRLQHSFLGGSQQRVIDHIRGIQQMISHTGGLFHV